MISIEVANGPTTADITLNDTLPAGIKTSGAITATGGTLSGCPAAGATTLTDCVIASGAATGTITVTVPITVEATATDGTNTVMASGGGSTCPTGTNCMGKTDTTLILDAISESVSKQPNIKTTTNVGGNDRFPDKSTFAKTGGTCKSTISMTLAGVVSYTTPRESSSCTIVYEVCAPLPNQTVCDSATLTVNTGLAPILTLTKSVSQKPLVIGKSGQSYKISIAVANGPTTTAFNVGDYLPTGITTSGAITATGGTLSGCPGAGSKNLSGCLIAAGAETGIISIIVPIAVDNTATSGTNSASISYSTRTCPSGSLCKGATDKVLVLGAMSGSVTLQPNIEATTDISANDKYPIGSSFTKTGGTCTGTISMTSAGVVSYTTPEENSTCTIVYDVCAPAPSTWVCDSATLTVNTGLAPVLTVTKSISQTPLVVGQSGQSYTINIAVANGPTTSSISLIDTLPTGIKTSDNITASGGILNDCPPVGARSLKGCWIAKGAVTGDIIVSVPITVDSTATDGKNTASVSGGGSTCPTGSGCSGATSATFVMAAISGTVTLQPDITTTKDVSENDKYLPNSAFTKLDSTCKGTTSMTAAGVASFTTPSERSSCTIDYKVCAPEPNSSVCDRATLTITSTAAPQVTVAKTSSHSSMVAGMENQFYTISLSVVNGPTTAPITLTDVLPTGMTLAASPYISSGVARLTGCPSTGNTLADCSIAAGVGDGTLSLKVPVILSPAAKGTAVNSVTLNGGGDTACPVAERCTASVTTVVDAADMKVVLASPLAYPVKGTAYPVGQKVACINASAVTAYNAICQVSNLPAGLESLCSPASPVASLAPGASIVCTISGTPTTNAPLNADVLTGSNADSVISNNQAKIVSVASPQLTLVKTVTPSVLKVGASGQYYTLTLTVADGPTFAPIRIHDDLPAGVTTSGAISAVGATLTGCPAAKANRLEGCALTSGIGNGTVVITVPVAVSSGASTGNNTASVTGEGTQCSATAPCTSSVEAKVVTPSLQVSKTVSANPMLIGADNQYYTINIQVMNGPSTAPIVLNDTFGPGITTRAALLVTGGSLTGCEAASRAGATSLTGCTLADGIDSVQIQVPVEVHEQAEGPAGGNNTVTASGGGDPGCPYAGNCVGFTGQVAVKFGELGSLFIRKEVDKSIAEVGDVLTYRITVRSTKVKGKVTIKDHLPLGLRLIAGSSTTSGISGVSRLRDPVGFPGPDLNYVLPLTAINQDVVLTYRVRVGMGAEQGDGTNRVQASMVSGRLQSMQARVKVKITGGVFTRDACIVGKVYADCNDNNQQEKGEPGIPGAKVYLEDGTSLTTDQNGAYSLCGVRPITHVMRLDERTLPKGVELGITTNRNMGDAKSLFVDLLAGQLHPTEFRIRSCSPDLFNEIDKRQKGQWGGFDPFTERLSDKPVQFESGPAPSVRAQ
jgi:uncharacterized repeat protein (TIGR01451 family)